jgi:hypothetical protein
MYLLLNQTLGLGLELRNTCVEHSIPKDQKNLDSRRTSVRQSSPCSLDRECGSPDDSLLALSAILSAPAMGPVSLIHAPHSSVGDPNTSCRSESANACLPRLSCQGCTDIIKDRNCTLFHFSRVQISHNCTLFHSRRVQISQSGQISFVVDSVLILLIAPGLMSVGFGLAAIRASRERGHRDGRWQARRLHLFQPRLRGGRRRFPGGGRPPTPGTPLLRKSSAAQGRWGPTVGPSSKTRWLLLVQQEQETLLARRTLAIALG